MTDIRSIAAKMTRESSGSLERALLAMSDERAAWKPLDVGRSAINQVVECAGLCLFGAEILNNRAMAPTEAGMMENLLAELDTVEKAVAALQSNTETLIAAIEGFPVEQLDDAIKMPWFDEPWTFVNVVFMTYWNNVYHLGQINYIQTLYGDNEMH